MDSDKDNPVPDQQNDQQPAGSGDDPKEEEPPPETYAQSSPLPPDLANISDEVDKYISSLLAGASTPPDVPIVIEQFLVLVEEKMDDYDSGDCLVKWNRLKEEDAAWFLEAVDRISSLSRGFAKFSSDYKYAYSINRVGCVLQRAMSYLEEEFKLMLEEYKVHTDAGTADVPCTNKNDSKSKQQQQQPFIVSAASPSNQEPGAADGSSVFGYSEETTSDLIKLAKAMIDGGYEAECCHVYFVVRRDALEEYIVQLGLDKHSIDDIHKKSWESLEREIELWILRFTNLTKSQFKSEKRLSDSVFAGHASISEKLFRGLSCSITKHIIKFAEAVALTRRSPDKLFKYLTVYETVREVINGIGSQLTQGVAVELKNEAWMIRSHLGEAMISILTELENSIKNDHGKNPVPGGAVHPLTTYILNYLEYTAIYKKTLEQVYLEHQRLEDAAALAEASESSTQEATQQQQSTAASSPFQIQILRIMDLLDSNIEAKSKFYKDTSLTSIFMMNNGRYMLKKIKKSDELHSLLGETWYRKMSSDLRNYHKGYQRETWGKLLGYLNPEGLTGNNKHVKPMLKERFKNFNSLFDEIRKTQTNWVISDEQLQSELRVSISNMVVPAYRSFLARYSQIFSAGRQTEKYIKHQPDDVETAIDGLFSGIPGSSGKRKL